MLAIGFCDVVHTARRGKLTSMAAPIRWIQMKAIQVMRRPNLLAMEPELTAPMTAPTLSKPVMAL